MGTMAITAYGAAVSSGPPACVLFPGGRVPPVPLAPAAAATPRRVRLLRSEHHGGQRHGGKTEAERITQWDQGPGQGVHVCVRGCAWMCVGADVFRAAHALPCWGNKVQLTPSPSYLAI